MKSFSFAYILSAVILATNFAFAADGQDRQLSSQPSTSPRQSASKMVLAQSATLSGSERSIIIVSGKNAKPGSVGSPAPKVSARSGSERSIIIVGGKNAKPGSVGSPGSKVMLNPQPLPPKTKLEASTNSNASKVMLNPQPLPPKVR
jgi:hypothetical protein